MQRREFFEAGIAAGAGFILGQVRAAESQPAPAAAANDAIHVALVGAGVQGRALLNAAVAIPGVRIRAVCDIWRYARRAAVNILEAHKQQAADYADYREMLAKEKDLQAAIIATPDFLHAEHTNACLQAGLHVYCEKAMATTLDAARSMVRTMRQSGRLLQIGYQRRSNPRYRHVRENLLEKAKLTGRLTHVGGRWFHPVRDDAGWPKKFAMRDDELKRYGYASMHELRNWRFFKRLGGGPFFDFGAHQADVAGWFLGAAPKSVVAVGGVDYYRDHQWADNVTAIVEYGTPGGTVRAVFEVQTTTSGGGESSVEHFMGADGSIRISENPKWTKVFREAHAADWDPWVRAGYLAARDEPATKPATSEEVHVRETGIVVPYDLPVVLDKPLHQPHLENFFDAVRGKAKLHCPADEAFRTEVVVHKVNEALAKGQALAIAPEEFGV
ncbi:MAG: Gfo/Idh/MocA family oxidoreductase [Thermoguttaceae bacterium]|jgi:predicted dehydrogenase|nr:Gfo/Idh/MocA family oxidoreductase [Thermoguttaceae bacterium]